MPLRCAAFSLDGTVTLSRQTLAAQLEDKPTLSAAGMQIRVGSWIRWKIYVADEAIDGC